MAALGGLLHDVGKLHQRAHWGLEEPRPHTYWTEGFVKGLGPAELGLLGDAEAERLAFAASHHHQAKPEGWAPGDDPLAWTVTLADNYASREREEGEQRQGLPHRVPLRSIFAQIKLNAPPAEGSAYSMKPLEPGALFPLVSAEPSLAYRELTDRLRARLADLAKKAPIGPDALLANLNAFLLEAAWCVPSDTQSEPDVSLYDHLRLTAAFAAALWRHHELKDGEVRVERLREEDEKKFLLAIGDLGGIQRHIYRIREAEAGVGGIAKRLRARSLEVALATEAFARDVLDALGLTFLNRILSAGGRFALLLPAGALAGEKGRPVGDVLEAAAERWERWALENGATLVPTLAWYAFSPKDLREGGFGGIYDAAGRELREQKLRPFARAGGDLLGGGEGSLRPCPVCDARPAAGQNPDGSWKPCLGCQAEAEIGQRLPRKTVVSLGRSEPKPPYFRFPGLYAVASGTLGFVYRSRMDFAPDRKPFEVRPLTARVPSVGDAVRLLEEDYPRWLESEGLGKVLVELGASEERPLTFEEIAHFSRGAPYLGVLMLDADRMGEVFGRGLRGGGADLRTPSRLATLSRMFEAFFGFLAVEWMEDPMGELAGFLDRSPEEAAIARRYPLIYGVYAGGDDVFLIGPWDALLQYALELEALYRRFTGHHPDLTLSGGFVLAKPHTPLPLIADRVRRAEKQAKEEGRNRLTLFGHAVRWDVLRRLIATGRRLKALIEEGELPRGIGHRLLGLWELYRTWALPEPGRAPDPKGLRYKPLLFYLRRNKEVEKRWEALFRPLMNQEDERMRHLPVWVQYALYAGRGGRS